MSKQFTYSKGACFQVAANLHTHISKEAQNGQFSLSDSAFVIIVTVNSNKPMRKKEEKVANVGHCSSLANLGQRRYRVTNAELIT